MQGTGVRALLTPPLPSPAATLLVRPLAELFFPHMAPDRAEPVLARLIDARATFDPQESYRSVATSYLFSA